MVQRRENVNMAVEEAIADQVPEFVEEGPVTEQEVPQQEPQRGLVGMKLGYKANGYGKPNKEADAEMVNEKHLSRIGENISDNADFREGWLEVDRALLGERDVFYPEDWVFRIKPATVEAVRNWSTIDEENPNSVDDVFNEMLKNCLSIRTANGPQPWSAVNSWDRFFFISLIREYTFINGEQKIEFTQECPNCGCDVTFTLNSQALMYDMPGDDVMQYYNAEERTWYIDPVEFGVQEDPVTLYLPTLDKDAAIKAWLFDKVRENRNAKVDSVLVKFLPWMTNKISKDPAIAKKQIKQIEMQYKAWDTDMFTFMDGVIKNITVTPETTIIATCDSCGEEATASINFPGGISSLFAMGSGHQKFGKK